MGRKKTHKKVLGLESLNLMQKTFFFNKSIKENILFGN
jgi:hypothetical protein